MKIGFRHKGDFSKTTNYLQSIKQKAAFNDNKMLLDIEALAQQGLDALMSATPKRTGLTSRSWTYEIVRTETSITVEYKNTNIQNGVNVAIVLDHGHYSKGHWILGRHYIEPAILPIFEQISNALWEAFKEV